MRRSGLIHAAIGAALTLTTALGAGCVTPSATRTGHEQSPRVTLTAATEAATLPDGAQRLPSRRLWSQRTRDAFPAGPVLIESVAGYGNGVVVHSTPELTLVLTNEHVAAMLAESDDLWIRAPSRDGEAFPAFPAEPVFPSRQSLALSQALHQLPASLAAADEATIARLMADLGAEQFVLRLGMSLIVDARWRAAHDLALLRVDTGGIVLPAAPIAPADAAPRVAPGAYRMVSMIPGDEPKVIGLVDPPWATSRPCIDRRMRQGMSGSGIFDERGRLHALGGVAPIDDLPIATAPRGVYDTETAARAAVQRRANDLRTLLVSEAEPPAVFEACSKLSDASDRFAATLPENDWVGITQLAEIHAWVAHADELTDDEELPDIAAATRAAPRAVVASVR